MGIRKDRCAIAYGKFIEDISKTIKNSKILDIGCGNGNYTQYFCRNNNKVIGIDIEDFRKKEFSENFEFVKYNGKRIPFKDNFFDCIISWDVIEHVEDDKLFVEEIKRVLRKGRVVFLGIPNKNRLSNILRKIIGKSVTYPLLIAENRDLGRLIHIREYTSSELKKLFENFGFKNVNIKSFWLGLRGKVNLGFDFIFLNSLKQYLFLKAYK